jgi:hypothetical protein
MSEKKTDMSELVKVIPGILNVVLEHADRWKTGQKIGASLVCLIGIAVSLSGVAPMKIVIAALLALFGLAFLTIPRKVLEANSFVLRGARGEPRAVLASVQIEEVDTAALMLLDAFGKARAMLSSTMKDGGYRTGLSLIDDSGYPRTQLWFDEKNNLMVFGDSDGNPRAYLRLDDDQAASLSLSGKQLLGGVKIMSTKDGTPRLQLLDTKDKVKTAMSISDGEGYMAFFTEEGSIFHTVPSPGAKTIHELGIKQPNNT